jgi:hypothetical protein
MQLGRASSCTILRNHATNTTRRLGYRRNATDMARQPTCRRRRIHGSKMKYCVNYTKFDYLYGLVATATANPIANSATGHWFVGYSKRTPDALPLVCFWIRKSQGQGRKSHFIQNASKLNYLYGLVATATANPIANSATILWFV